MGNGLDLVICGPDMSGTSTQINDTIEFFRQRNMQIRDMRGTEMDALFHAAVFKEHNQQHISLKSFLADDQVSENIKSELLRKITDLLIGGATNEDLRIASMVNNKVSTYVDPDSADVWIFEEPTKRGSGQENRAVEQQRSQYDSTTDPVAAALFHQGYRISEYLRFRRILRQKGKIIVRSRSEESACYQIRDPEQLPSGIDREAYIGLPGHAIAFKHAPTHLFVVCAPSDWTAEEYLRLKKERSNGRFVDDYEANVSYQLLINRRYASDWLENLYQEACERHGGIPPSIRRFSIYDSKNTVREKMRSALNLILAGREQTNL
ncbi:MAG: hypothetical protein ACOCWQ_02185 [Nanoarchaeota archaeon]